MKWIYFWYFALIAGIFIGFLQSGKIVLDSLGHTSMLIAPISYLACFLLILTVIVQVSADSFRQTRENRRQLAALFPGRRKLAEKAEVLTGLGIDEATFLKVTNDQSQGYSVRDVKRIIRAVREIEAVPLRRLGR